MEFWPVHEGRDKRFLVRPQLRFPTIIAHPDTQADGARVRHELSKVWTNPVSNTVEYINQSADLLELYRVEESRRDVLTTPVITVLVDTAGEYLVTPEVEPDSSGSRSRKSSTAAARSIQAYRAGSQFVP
jgi:hypothetical protein